jgi:hypothetical protein
VRKISRPEFRGLFRGHQTAFHLELRDAYGVTEEDEPFRKFLAGQPDDLAWLASWLGHVRDATSAGVTIQRARVVTEPLNDYARFLLHAVTPANVAAGEDVRYLPRPGAAGIDLPGEDCWLLDDTALVLVTYHDDGRMDGFYLADDAELAARYARACAQVWARAIPYQQYLTMNT